MCEQGSMRTFAGGKFRVLPQLLWVILWVPWISTKIQKSSCQRTFHWAECWFLHSLLGCKMWWVSKWKFTVSGYSSEQYWSDSKHDTTLRSTLSTLSCDLHKWISYSKVAHTLMLMTLGALVSSAAVSVLNKELLCLFLVSPSRWLPSQQTSSSLPVTLRRAVIYDCFSLIIRELSAATLQLSAALHMCGSFPKDFGLITVCLWQRAKRLQSRASLCGSHPVKSELFSLQTEGVLNTQAGRRNETVSTTIKRMKSSKRRQCSFHFTTSPFLSSFAVNQQLQCLFIDDF